MKTWRGLNSRLGMAPVGLMMSLGAGAGEILSEEDYFSEQPVVLSASRLSQPVNRAPAAVTVITREMIEATGFRHLVDVLRLVPGFVVGWSGGNSAAATHIGLGNEYPHWMQIMVDGRSVYNPSYGHTAWRGIPLTLDDVDRIEVVRGPNAANDGLNSMLGTVHIYTRHSAVTQGGMGEVLAGDKRQREANLRYGAQAGNRSWRLGLLTREDERHGVAHDRATDMQLSFRGDVQPTLRDDVMLQFGLSQGDWQGTNVGFLQDYDQHVHYLNGFGNLQWKHALGEGREWQFHAHHTFEQNKETIPLPLPLDPLSGDYRTTVSAIQFTYLDKGATEWHTSLSGEYRLNRVHLPALLSGTGYFRDEIARASGALEWTPSSAWVWHAGAMLEKHSDTGDTYFSPRLALNWIPSQEQAFRLAASQGMSALGLFVSNTDVKLTINGGLYDQIYLSTVKLDPEKIDNIELGYLLNLPSAGLNLDARAYHNRIHDIVDTVNIAIPGDIANGRAKTYLNRSAVTLRGLEYQLKWRAATGGSLALTQSWISAKSDDGAYFAMSVPRHTFSLLASHPVAGLDASMGYYHVETMRWLGGKFDSHYNRLDLRLAKNWKTADGGIEAALVLQSLNGDEEDSFSEYLYRHQKHGRRGYLSLKYEFR
jgi:iron complex outermembrane receptor protein